SAHIPPTSPPPSPRLSDTSSEPLVRRPPPHIIEAPQPIAPAQAPSTRHHLCRPPGPGPTARAGEQSPPPHLTQQLRRDVEGPTETVVIQPSAQTSAPIPPTSPPPASRLGDTSPETLLRPPPPHLVETPQAIAPAQAPGSSNV